MNTPLPPPWAAPIPSGLCLCVGSAPAVRSDTHSGRPQLYLSPWGALNQPPPTPDDQALSGEPLSPGMGGTGAAVWTPRPVATLSQEFWSCCHMLSCGPSSIYESPGGPSTSCHPALGEFLMSVRTHPAHTNTWPVLFQQLGPGHKCPVLSPPAFAPARPQGSVHRASHSGRWLSSSVGSSADQSEE